MLQRIKKWWDRALYWWVVSRHPCYQDLKEDYEEVAKVALRVNERATFYKSQYLVANGRIAPLMDDLLLRQEAYKYNPMKCARCGNKTLCDACWGMTAPMSAKCLQCKGPLIEVRWLTDRNGTDIRICGQCFEHIQNNDMVPTDFLAEQQKLLGQTAPFNAEVVNPNVITIEAEGGVKRTGRPINVRDLPPGVKARLRGRSKDE